MSTDHQKAMARAYQQAQGELRRRHHDEFKRILGEIYASEGLDVERRRNREEIERDRLDDAKRVLKAAGITELT